MKKNPFIQGAMIATIGVIISKILGIIYVIPFYAIIGQKGGALYGYAYTIYGIFLNLSSIGIPLAISRLTSEYNTLEQYQLKERTFKIGKRVINILSLISFLALMIFAPTIAHIFIGNIKGGNTPEDVAFVIRVIATAVLVVPTLSVTKGYFQGHKYITASTISQVLEQFARVVIVIAGSYIAIKVLGLPIRAGVGIAAFGATIGALIAYIYLLLKQRQNKEYFHQTNSNEQTSNMSNKSIAIKILRYAFPFIFSSLVFSFYDFYDLSTVIKTLVNGLHYNVGDAEVVMSILSTWGNKLNTIVSAIATGLVTSLIPNITSSFVKNDMDDVHSKINKSLQILLFTTLPMAIGLSILSTPVWTIFYGYSNLSSNIFKYYVFIALVQSFITTLNAIMQSLNEHKRMIIYLVIGFLTKVATSVPLMYLFDYIGFSAGYGAITANILGISVSIILMLVHLHNEIGVNYKSTVKKFLCIGVACLAMVIVILLFEQVLPITTNSRLTALIITSIYSLIGAGIYFAISIKFNLLNRIFGKEAINKLLRKFKLARKEVKE